MDGQIRVFIADASRSCVALLTDLLEREEDFCITGFALSGDDALRSFPETRSDLLLTDLLLPGLDGLSLLRKLRKAGELKHAIVLSGFYNDRIARSVSVVADNYLPKPCRPDALLRSMRDCVRGGQEMFCRNIESIVGQALVECGMQTHLTGFVYLRSGIARTLADRSLLRGVTKSLYRDIAKEFDTTPACVERSMRSAIEHAWQNMPPEKRQRRFGALFGASEQAPSNVPFLSAMTEYVGELDGSRRVFF